MFFFFFMQFSATFFNRNAIFNISGAILCIESTDFLLFFTVEKKKGKRIYLIYLKLIAQNITEPTIR